jgi:hypothetical protein
VIYLVIGYNETCLLARVTRCGEFFAFWASDNFGRLLVKLQKLSIFLPTYIFFGGKKYALFLTAKNGLGYILDDFVKKIIWSPCCWPL